MWRRRIPLIAALGLTTACAARAARTTAPDSVAAAEIRASIEKGARGFMSANPDTILAHYARDIVLSYPGIPDQDYATLVSAYGELRSRPADVVAKTVPTFDEILVSGTLALVRLRWTTTISQGSRTSTRHLKDFQVWRRERDGRWAFIRGMHYPESTAEDTTATKASLMAADRDLARAIDTRGPNAFFEALDPDAAVLLWGQPTILRGADARDAFTARYRAPSSYTWRAAHALASTDGLFGCTAGFSRFKNAADTTTREYIGAYLTCWSRTPGGPWRIVGHQRRDSPPRDLAASIDTPMPNAPHSATVATGDNPRSQVVETDVAFAAMAADPAGPGPAFAAFVARDGIAFGVPGLPQGPAAIEPVFDGYANERVILWVPVRSFGVASGGLGFATGYSADTPRAGKQGPRRYGKFFTIWRQEPDGQWRWVFDLGSVRP
jgi:steroid delta-isomerase